MSNDAFKRLMESSSRNVQSEGPAKKRAKTVNDCSKNIKKSGVGMSWKSGLRHAITDAKNVIDSTDTLVVIKDKYPKAKYHYLFLPKKLELNSPKELTALHLPLLKEMKCKAEELLKSHPNVNFRIGFHAKPSMDHLHLHVVSTDFLSLCLKTKKHWNSYNTGHFLQLEDIIRKLEVDEALVDYPTDKEIEAYMKKQLSCNQCSFEAKNMPNLKTHLETHTK